MQTENCTRVIICYVWQWQEKYYVCACHPIYLFTTWKYLCETTTKNNCTRHSNIIILQQWIPWHWQLYHVNCMHYIKFSCHTLSLTRSTSSSSQLQALNKYEHFYLTSWAFKIVHFSLTHTWMAFCNFNKKSWHTQKMIFFIWKIFKYVMSLDFY